MKQWIITPVKWLLFWAAALGLMAAGRFPAAAASIDRIRLRLGAESLDETGMPILEAESRDKMYEVTGVERVSGDGAMGPAREKERGKESDKKENNSEEKKIKELEMQQNIENKSEQISKDESEDADMDAETASVELIYEIELESDGEDTFSILRQEDIQFSGLHAVCSKAVRKDNGTTLVLTIELEDAGEIIGTVDTAEWLEKGIGRWKTAPGASAYLVMLYRDMKRVGHPHRTSAEQYDFAPLMQENGVYHFKVFPLTKQGKRGQSAESAWRKVTEEEVLQNKKQWGEKSHGWQREGESPSYILMDGTYPQEDSLLIGETWQKFDGNGKLVSSTEKAEIE